MAHGWVGSLGWLWVAALAGLALAAVAAATEGGPENHVDKDRLIALGPDDEGQWMTLHDVLQLVRKGTPFMDVTRTRTLGQGTAPARVLAYPLPSHQDEVRGYISQVDIGRVQTDLTAYSSFYTRYYTASAAFARVHFLDAQSPTGIAAANWLYSLISDIVQNATGITVTQFKHPDFEQRSVIARFSGQDETLPRVIVGAHLDSINMFNETEGRSPGADDNGSGTTVLLEALRVLVGNAYRPKHPLEFQWYAAEEVGLIGSAEIAAQYQETNVPVYGVMNMDMIGFGLGDVPIRIMTDYVDAELTDFVRVLVDTYTTLERRDRYCGYACSEYASRTGQLAFALICHDCSVIMPAGIAQGIRLPLSPKRCRIHGTMAQMAFEHKRGCRYWRLPVANDLSRGLYGAPYLLGSSVGCVGLVVGRHSWHQAKDDINLINWPQVEQLVHLTLGYAVELSYGPS